MRPGVIVFVAAGAALLGLGAGWLAKGDPPGRIQVVQIPREIPSKPVAVAKIVPAPFPDYPKPKLEPPQAQEMPIPEAGGSAPLGGSLPSPAPLGVGPISPLPPAGPMVPNVAKEFPVADLNADEALVRRTVLQAGGEIVSVDDAKDSSGKVGRNLVVETTNGGRERLRTTLRRALGDRAILSDGGAGAGSSPELKKAEDALAALKKQRESARIDYLPDAPVLRDLDETILKQERTVGELRKRTARQRLNVFLHPVLGA